MRFFSYNSRFGGGVNFYMGGGKFLYRPQFKDFTKFGKSEIYERFPIGKDARRIFDGKGVSPLQKLSDFSKKM